MTNYDDPYRAYTEGSLVSSDPLRLVVALYEGAVASVRDCRRCLESGDIWGRAKAVSKAVNILIELTASLDQKKGGEISVNLARLYNYMQRKLMEGHAQRSAAAFSEVENLLSTLLEGWSSAAKRQSRGMLQPALLAPGPEPAGGATSAPPHEAYSGYFAEAGERIPELALLF